LLIFTDCSFQKKGVVMEKKVSKKKTKKDADKKPDVYVSIDGEFTGRIPGRGSMISFGAVAYALNGTELTRFKVNMKELRGSKRDKDVMRWWRKFPKAWRAATKNPIKPRKAMKLFAAWLKLLPGNPKLLGWPLPVDFQFIYWYYWRFVGEMPPFGFDGMDVKSYVAGRMNIPLSEVSQTKLKKLLRVRLHGLQHDPLCDADEQGRLFFAIANYKP